jgi:ribosomal protein S27E
MQLKLTRCFIDSAAALLAAVATAYFICNLANASLVQPRDPIFMISMRTLFWILGASELAVALICIFARRPRLKLVLVLWLATSLLLYRFGLQWAGVHNPRGYLGILADTFSLSTGATDIILKALVLYLLIGSSALVVWSRLQQLFPARAKEEGFLKISCPHCGGPVAFPAHSIGQKIACPHCQTTITLRKPD